jgi:hypothetical protein
MPQIARGDTVEVGQAPVRACAEVYASRQIEQTMVSAVSDRNGQGLFVKGFDIAADDSIHQPTQSALLRVALAQIVKFFLKSAESPQAVMLLRKPRMQIVHGCLFNWEKKLPSCTVGEGGGQMLFLQMSLTADAIAENFLVTRTATVNMAVSTSPGATPLTQLDGELW